jgi:hypothetical protein
LTGCEERLAWRCGAFIGLDAVVSVRVCFDGEDEGIDLVAELDGEFKYWAVSLRICFF